ncbi:BglG family transcription antiterminator [Amphibacillus cookii]|uniref:BglG family transcription antiterminator n=1 Tax=Amphibacillus cookii TaxID=767787 RepID=UPI001957BC13|nr:BglG family transcription antiterminator [Amphibacillus cookii]MBM7543225.1 lichenan operon transcriptional antiterminator [Amphibacillus cookii]
MITKRQREILRSLLNNNELLTAEWIGKELGVSDRTIRTEIKVLQLQSQSLGVSIKSIRGKGYKLKVCNQQLFENECKVPTDEVTITNYADYTQPNNRVLYILKRFLLGHEPVKCENLEEELFVSKPKIQNDLKVVREILKRYQLKLITRPHYGTLVEGDEHMKRLCLSNYLLSRSSNFNIDSNSFRLIDEKLFNKIKEIIIKKVSANKIEISDFSLDNLASHIAIGCRRIEEGFVIENLEDDLIGNYPIERMVANEIVKDVEAYTGLPFPDSEINYIIIHLLGTKLVQQDKMIDLNESNEVTALVQCMIDTLAKELYWDFREDTEFIQALILHIKPAINRLRYQMNIRNPLLNEIKVKYPSAIEGAVIASRCIERHLTINVGEHEIAYIALHIGVALERLKTRRKKPKRVIVVCTSGVGSAKLLYYQLQNIFSDTIEIVETTNYYQLKDCDLSSIDFIISTIPIDENIDVPIQVVSTILDEGDVSKIKRSLSPVKKEDEINYLDESRVFIHKDFQDKESVIHFLCNELYKQGLVSKEYVHLVLDREVRAPTVFGNLVAIPHPVTPVTEETFWTVCTLKRPIEWHDKQMVQFICLLNIRRGPKGDLENMYQKLIKLLGNKSEVRKIVNSDNVKEVIDILRK